jgi:hypothetical protein
MAPITSSSSLLLSLVLLADISNVVVAQGGENNNNNNNNQNNAVAVTYDIRDTNYYPSGVSPYAKNPMYYSEPSGVLNDLTKFDALYIHYHSCV